MAGKQTLFLLCCIFAGAYDCHAFGFFKNAHRMNENVAQAFIDNELSKDLGITPPDVAIKIKYDSGAKVKLGNTLTPTQVRNPPVQFSFPSADPEGLYTLILTDPDAPGRAQPVVREWHHWLAVNVPGSDLVEGRFKGRPALRELGDTLTDYVGSGPPEGTGLHRYTFLAFRQPDRICPDEAKLTRWSADGRGSFSIAKFADKYELGDPVAGNFYQAEWDEYVPQVHKQLSGQC